MRVSLLKDTGRVCARLARVDWVHAELFIWKPFDKTEQRLLLCEFPVTLNKLHLLQIFDQGKMLLNVDKVLSIERIFNSSATFGQSFYMCACE